MENRILLTDRQRTHRLDAARVRDAVAGMARDLWDHPVEISLTFLGRRAMAAANREFRGYLGSTDQISFPTSTEIPTPDGVALVGDIVICPAVISAQCGTLLPGERPPTGTPDRELCMVLCHGLLHLLGHTHANPQDTAAMIAAEGRLFSAHVSALDGVYLA